MKLKDIEAPAKLTAVRLVLIPLFMIFAVYDFGLVNGGKYTWPRIIAAALFLLTCIVNIVDKRLMRGRDISKSFWGFIDAVADRLVIFGALLAICFSDYILPEGFYKNFFFWSTAVIMFRELFVIGMCLADSSKDVKHLYGRKTGLQKNLLWIATALQMICIAVVILEPIILPQKVFSQFRLLSLVVTALAVSCTVVSCLYSIIAYKKYVTELCR